MTDPIHVLLIEDNPTDVLLLQETLAYISSAQFNVINAERLVEGLERLSQEFFDVVVNISKRFIWPGSVLPG